MPLSAPGHILQEPAQSPAGIWRLIEAHHDRARTTRVCVFEHPRRLRGRRVPPDALGVPLGTVGTSYSKWPAARVPSARAITYAVRRGGPATFNRAARS
jgi:hypothetical protein